jgi:protein-disulfide isomerase
LVLACALLGACQSQTTAGAEPNPKAKPETLTLAGVDTSKLTEREKEQWSSYVGELLAPCPDQPVSIAQCVTESRKCETCKPAAEFLVKQVTRGRTRAQAEDAYRLRFSPDEVETIDLAGSPTLGANDAAVTIVEWADFECPFCGIASPMLDKALESHPNDVRLVFKHYPLSAHEHAEMAARAAVAAGLQGKFWEMHHALFKQQGNLEEAALDRLAAELGLDVKRFSQERKGEAAADRVTQDKRQAEKLNLRGTPMIYINGRHFELELFNLVEDLDGWIQLEVEQRTGKRVQPVEPKKPALAAPGPSGLAAAPPPSASAGK